jgi:RNA polymerase sigma-B factor
MTITQPPHTNTLAHDSGRRSPTDRDTVRDWFVEFRRTGSREIRDRLVERYADLAYAVARRYVRPSTSIEDLHQIALIGLLKAVHRYDPDRGTTFPTFAIPTMTGEIRRHYRDRGWIVRPPRSVQEHAHAVAGVLDDLTQERGHSPSPGEVAQRSGLSIDHVLDGTAARRAFARAPWSTEIEETALSYREAEFERVEQRLAVTTLLRHLPPRERAVVTMRFFDGMTQAEIGKHLGVSQMQVSRLLTKSLSVLRACAQPVPKDLGGAA